MGENTLGVMYVSYIEPKDSDRKPGWFTRQYRTVKSWFTGVKPGDPPKTPYGLDELLSHLPNTEDTREVFTKTQNFGEPKDDVPGYLLIIRGVDGEIEVRVRDGYAQR